MTGEGRQDAADLFQQIPQQARIAQAGGVRRFQTISLSHGQPALGVQDQQCPQGGPALAHHQGLLKQRIEAQGLFQVHRRHLLAVGKYQDILDPPGNGDPSAIESSLIAGVQPALVVQYRPGSLRVAPITLHDDGAPHPQFISLPQGHLDPRQRLADTGRIVGRKAVDADHGTGLCQAIPLKQGQAQAEKEPRHLPRQGRPATDGYAQPATEAGPHRPRDQAAQPGRNQQQRVPAPPALLVLELAPAGRDRQPEEQTHQGRPAIDLILETAVNPLEDPGHGDQHRRPHHLQVLSQLADGPGKGHRRPRHHRQVVARGTLQGMGEGQKGEKNVLPVAVHHLQGSSDIAEHVAMAQHDPLGATRGPRGVDDGRQVRRFRRP